MKYHAVCSSLRLPIRIIIKSVQQIIKNSIIQTELFTIFSHAFKRQYVGNENVVIIYLPRTTIMVKPQMSQFNVVFFDRVQPFLRIHHRIVQNIL